MTFTVSSSMLAHGRKVKHAVIGGRHVVDEGKVTTFDEQQLYREAEDLKQRIYHDRTP